MNAQPLSHVAGRYAFYLLIYFLERGRERENKREGDMGREPPVSTPAGMELGWDSVQLTATVRAKPQQLVKV